MSCCTQTEPQIKIWNETKAQLDDRVFMLDYGALINRSLAGDSQSLLKLIELGKYTDAAGSYGFGCLLQKIALKIGDRQFAETVKVLPPEKLKSLYIFLLAGFDYGNPQYQIEDFEFVLPITYKLLEKYQ